MLDLEDIFGPEGPLQRALPDFRFRRQQLRMAERVAAALENREALVLFYPQGMKYHAIVDAPGIPLGSVKSRLHAGLQRIKTMLEHVSEEEVIRCR